MRSLLGTGFLEQDLKAWMVSWGPGREFCSSRCTRHEVMQMESYSGGGQLFCVFYILHPSLFDLLLAINFTESQELKTNKPSHRAVCDGCAQPPRAHSLRRPSCPVTDCGSGHRKDTISTPEAPFWVSFLLLIRALRLTFPLPVSSRGERVFYLNVHISSSPSSLSPLPLPHTPSIKCSEVGNEDPGGFLQSADLGLLGHGLSQVFKSDLWFIGKLSFLNSDKGTCEQLIRKLKR